MIAALVVLACLTLTAAIVAGWGYAVAHEARRQVIAADRRTEHEHARVSELLHLLEARMAPAEFGAYVAPAFYEAPPEKTYLYTEDGLAWVDEDEFAEAP